MPFWDRPARSASLEPDHDRQSSAPEPLHAPMASHPWPPMQNYGVSTNQLQPQDWTHVPASYRPMNELARSPSVEISPEIPQAYRPISRGSQRSPSVEISPNIPFDSPPSRFGNPSIHVSQDTRSTHSNRQATTSPRRMRPQYLAPLRPSQAPPQSTQAHPRTAPAQPRAPSPAGTVNSIQETPLSVMPPGYHPMRSQSHRRPTFEESSDINLFAQAVSGIEGGNEHTSDEDSDGASGSTRNTHRANNYAPQPNTLTARQRAQSRYHSHSSPPPLNRGYSENFLSDIYDEPAVHHQHSMAPAPNVHELQSTHRSQPIPPRYDQGSNSMPNHAEHPGLFAEAITGIPPEFVTNDDDDLPDYATSQREAAAKTRREALMRAAELERRWAASSIRRR